MEKRNYSKNKSHSGKKIIFIIGALALFAGLAVILSILNPSVKPTGQVLLAEATKQQSLGNNAAVSQSPEPAQPAASPTPEVASAAKSVKPFPLSGVDAGSLPIGEGSKGKIVTELQDTLKELGYFKQNTTVIFGPVTKKALSDFQVASNLSASGVLDAKTLESLKNAWDNMGSASPASRPVTSQPHISPLPKDTSGAPKASVPEKLTLAGRIVGIDAGHQSKADSGMEPVAPGASQQKKKVSGGTSGVATHIPEYKLNLQVALQLQKKLEALGAKVIMTRVSNAVDISNSERAVMMNKSHVDTFVRIHANGNNNHAVHGMSILVPSKNGYLKGPLQSESERLGKLLLSETVKTTKARNLGISYRNDQTGINWSKVPVCIIEMGYMTNSAEDRLLNSVSYQKKIVDGLADGLIRFLQ